MFFTSELFLRGYRLGEFQVWYDALSDESPFKRDQELLISIVNYQRIPSAENEERLKNEIARQEKKAGELFFQNLQVSRWDEYIDRMAWVSEARTVLAGEESLARPALKWPEEDVDLLEVSRQIVKLRQQAAEQTEADNVREAIDSYERLAEPEGILPRIGAILTRGGPTLPSSFVLLRKPRYAGSERVVELTTSALLLVRPEAHRRARPVSSRPVRFTGHGGLRRKSFSDGQFSPVVLWSYRSMSLKGIPSCSSS